MPRRRHPSPSRDRSAGDTVRAHEQAIALRAAGSLRRRRARLPPRHRRLRGGRGTAPPRRRQRAGRAGLGAGGARSAARGARLPAPCAGHPGARPVARSRHRPADDPRAHRAGRHRPRAAAPTPPPTAGYQAALAAIRRRFGPRDRYMCGVLNDLGVLRKAQGRYADALAFYRRALPLIPRSDRDARATLAHNLGGIEHARGDYAAPKPTPCGRSPADGAARRRSPRRSPPTSRRWPPSSRPAAGWPRRRRSTAAPWPCSSAGWAAAAWRSALNLARSLAALEPGPRDAARGRAPLRPAVLAIQERLLGRGPPRGGADAQQSGRAAARAGNSARALALYTRALAQLSTGAGDRHPHTAPGRREPDARSRLDTPPPQATESPRGPRAGTTDEARLMARRAARARRPGRYRRDRGEAGQADVGIAAARSCASTSAAGGPAPAGARDSTPASARAARRRRPPRAPEHRRHRPGRAPLGRRLHERLAARPWPAG